MIALKLMLHSTLAKVLLVERPLSEELWSEWRSLWALRDSIVENFVTVSAWNWICETNGGKGNEDGKAMDS